MRSTWITGSRRWALAFVGVLVCGLLAWELLGLAGAAGRHAGGATVRPSAHANRLAARRVATRLLAETPLPEGAERAGSDESVFSSLTGPASAPQRTPQLVAAHRFWRVQGKPEAVISWIDGHPPANSKIIIRGFSGKSTARPPRSLSGRARREYARAHSVTTSWDATFAFPPRRERLATVWLSVTVAAAKHGGSEVRADALVVWRRVRPASEHIPSDVKEVSVKVRDPRKHINSLRHIGSPGALAPIVAVIEELQRPEGGASSCPADNGREQVITLMFRRRDGAPPVVRVRIDDNGCGSVRFFKGGREEPDLGEPSQATRRLHAILDTGRSARAPSSAETKLAARVSPQRPRARKEAAPVVKPRIVWDPIPFGSERKRQMAAYVKRHYGSFMRPTYRLIHPRA